MATLSTYSMDVTTGNWQVTGLSNPFNSTYYGDMVITSTNYGTGSIGSRPGGEISYASAPSPEFNSSPSISGSFTSLLAGSFFNIYAYAYDIPSGLYWYAGTTTLKSYPANVPWVDAAYIGPDVHITWADTDGVSTGYDLDYSWVSGSLNAHTDNAVTQIDANPSPLSAGQSGTVYILATAGNGLSSKIATSATFTIPLHSTWESQPYISSSSSTTTSITVTVTGAQAGTQIVTYKVKCNGIIKTSTANPATFTFTGLTPDTGYPTNYWASAPGYMDSDTWVTTIYTQQLTPVSTPTMDTVDAISYSKATVRWFDTADDVGYTIEIRYVSGDSLAKSVSAVTNATSVNVTGLSHSTSYYARVQAKGNGTTTGKSGWSGSYYFDTWLFAAPQITTYNLADATSVHLLWDFVQDATYYVQYKLSSVGTWTNYSGNPITPTEITITGLTAGQSYDFHVRAYSAELSGYTGYSNTVTVTVSPRPNNWLWTTGQDVNGHKIPGGSYSMLATEWNAFTQRVNDFRAHKGVAAYTFFNTVTSGNPFLAQHIGQAIDGISGVPNRSVVLPAYANAGDSITASILNQLMDSLNSTT